MGVVFLGEDPSLKRQVAIKMLDIGADSETDRDFLRSLLLRDARAAAILSHPNVVAVFDILEEGQSLYVVMEYIEGESLASYLDRTPIPDPDLIMNVLRQMAAGLDYTHLKGIIHRDIKPGNVMVGPSGNVKILDFGIARMTDVRTTTPTGMVMGTLDYMAPEQLKAAMIDGRADQYSLAAVGFRMLTGSTLFGRQTLATLAYKVANEAPPAVRARNAAVPAEVDQVVAKALAKRPEERYPSCSAFIEDLGRALSGTVAMPPESPTQTIAMPVMGEVTTKPENRSRAIALIVGGVVLVCGASAMAVWQPWKTSQRHVTVAPPTAIIAHAPKKQAPAPPVKAPPFKSDELPPEPPPDPTAETKPPAIAPVAAAKEIKKAVVESLSPPIIENFSAKPSVIQSGQETELLWKVSGATDVSITGIGQALSAQASRPVCPTESRSYVLRATGPGGKIDQTVTVSVTIPPGKNVKFIQFYGNPTRINVGESSVLRWHVENASSVWIDQGIGQVDACGDRVVQPKTTTKYQLSYQNDRGTLHSKPVEITVR